MFSLVTGHALYYSNQIVVRYLKAWADHQNGRRGRMPSGLILTVLAANNFREDNRDDISLKDTIKAINAAVNSYLYVINPVDSAEVLSDRLTEVQKERFQDAISDLASNAAEAIVEDDREKSSRLWRKHFGDRFPAVENDNSVSENEKNAAKLAAVHLARKPAKPWGWL